MRREGGKRPGKAVLARRGRGKAKGTTGATGAATNGDNSSAEWRPPDFEAVALMLKNSKRPADARGSEVMLAVFCADFEAGNPPRVATLYFLYLAFQRVLRGESADVALELVRGRPGRHKKSRALTLATRRDKRDFDLARSVRRAHEFEGRPLMESYRAVARTHHVSLMMVRRAWQRWRNFLRAKHGAGAALYDSIDSQQTPPEGSASQVGDSGEE